MKKQANQHVYMSDHHLGIHEWMIEASTAHMYKHIDMRYDNRIKAHTYTRFLPIELTVATPCGCARGPFANSIVPLGRETGGTFTYMCMNKAKSTMSARPASIKRSRDIPRPSVRMEA
jgi:hypothetical protein